MSAPSFAATLQQLLEILGAAGVVDPSTVEGCSEADIAAVQAQAGGCLPMAYKIFLECMGRQAGGFLVGTDVFYPAVLNLRSWAQEMLEEGNSGFVLPDTAFVFLMHQGYQCLYFLMEGLSEDPPVFRVAEGMTAAEQFAPSLSAAIEILARTHLALVASVVPPTCTQDSKG
jgi:hypothetical protein